MLRRLLVFAWPLALGAAAAWITGVPLAAQASAPATSTFQIPASTYTPPKTPWGDPDIQGVWDNHNVIPMQRPANLAGKKTFTDEEYARFAASRAGNGTDAVCLQNDERCAKATVAEIDRVKAYNGFWTPLDFVKDNRSAHCRRSRQAGGASKGAPAGRRERDRRCAGGSLGRLRYPHALHRDPGAVGHHGL
jgi:hypothetical protein